MVASDAVNLNNWRQGDFALGDVPLPIISSEDNELAVIYADGFPGVAVLSQSCDIIRSVAEKPYVQVGLLIPASAEEIAAVRRNAKPRYAYIPGAAARGFVVDLDVTATVDKEVVATWVREQGCADDDERRAFAEQIGRQRTRFAFPDRYNDVLKPMRRWIESKRNTASPAGDLVRAIQEMRVVCDDWENPTSMTYIMIVDHRPEADVEAAWSDAVSTLEKREVPAPYPKPAFQIVSWDDLSAREYLQSDRLDFDGLSDA